jgi:hypothetical protein
MVSSRGHFFGAIEVAEGGTIVVASFVLASSLRKKSIQFKRRSKDKGNLEKRCENTYESSNPKISRLEPSTTVCSWGTSFGLDVPKEVKSFMRFRFFSAT